ncbi:MAG TPA: IPT/TIG domain-containing protein, partial [Bryobacteraceae bacterium]|nr:IPT/TIG domain-containing protein [Bryobacteraceae bacterium]
ADLIASAASIQITVVSGSVTSNALTFEVANGPALSLLSPGSATAGGGPFTLTLTGTGFTSAATVQWNSTSLATTFVSATQLTAAVPASLLAADGTAQITVLIGGVSSNPLSFVVSVLMLSSLGPATGAASGQPFTLTVNGSGFNSSSVVEWNGTPLPTTFGSANQLTAAVPGNLSQNPGSAQVSVLSNGVLSGALAFGLVYPLSSVNLTGLAATSVPTQPLSMNLKLASAAPTDLQGVLTLSFVPNAAGWPTNGYLDPALQFASGGTTFNFTIKAGTTSPTVSIPNIQQGTVAGQITVTLGLSMGTFNVLPAPLSLSATVPRLAPVVESCTMGVITNGAFSVQLDAYSTPRDLASAIYSFTAASGAQLTVTAANGGQVAGTSQISVPVTAQLSQWFAGSASQPNGSVFSLEAPFTLSGDASALQSVSVVLTNSIGASAQFSCTR